MGASVAPVEVRFSATGIDAVRAGLRAVRDEAKGVGTGAAEAGKEVSEGLSHGTIFGLAEFSRGLSRVAESGQASGLAMRELSGGIMRLGQSLGPGAGLIGIVAILGGVIVEHFMKAREEIKKTEDQFKQSIGNMANAGQSTELQKKLRELYFGTPYDEKGQLQNPSFIQGAFQGSLVDLRSRVASLNARLANPTGNNMLEQSMDVVKTKNAIAELQPRLDAAEAQYRRLVTAVETLQSQPAERSNLLGVKVTAPSLEAELRRDLHPPGDEFANLITGEQFQRSALKHMLPGQIGDMNRPLIDQLKQQLDVEMLKGRGATTTDERMEALKKYAEILKQIDELTGKPGELGVLGGKGPKGPKIGPTDTQALVEEFNKNVNEPLGRAIKDGLAKTLGSAIADGITAGFQSRSIGGAFKGMGKAILSGLGSIFEQMGETMITYGIAATGFAKAMLNPLTAGPAAIAYGALLVALGASLGAIAQGGSGGGYGGGSSSLPSIITTTYLTSGNAGAQGANMSPKGSGTTNYWVIGTDPKAWRDVQDQLDRNARLSGPGR